MSSPESATPVAPPARIERAPGAHWRILYRGSLSSCNYECGYCPFAKTGNTPAEMTADADALAQFVRWVADRTDRHIGILFTPWGEALVRRHYRRAMVELSRLDHVERVAAQTNLSYRTDWMGDADLDTLALWTTYHPSQVERERFLGRCRELDVLGVTYSVGMVGVRDDIDEIEAMRAELPDEIYLWVNAYKDEPNHYRDDDIERLSAVDPHFALNLIDHPSLGSPCRAGHTSFTVDHRGDVRRCHFIDEPIGNIHDGRLDDVLAPSACPNHSCGCHIGYVHRPDLGLYELFGTGVLERVPERWPDRSAGTGPNR